MFSLQMTMVEATKVSNYNSELAGIVLQCFPLSMTFPNAFFRCFHAARRDMTMPAGVCRSLFPFISAYDFAGWFV